MAAAYGNAGEAMANDPYSSPLAFFSGKLKRLRERAGMTQGDVARGTNYALSTVSAYETGHLIPPADFAVRADKLFGTGPASEGDEGDLEGLQKLVETVSVRPWFRDRIEVERKAREIREYDAYQIPGLLETEDYARAVISAGRPRMSDEEIERAVALRMTRQQILDRDGGLPADQDNTPRLWAIIDEAALLRVVGSPGIMRDQRDHLVKVAQRPNVTIQVVRNSEGVTCAYGRAFTILTPNSGSPVVYLEGIFDAHYIRNRDSVELYALLFDHLRASALTDDKSIQLIQG
jgi:transcriptional regulator with XRE-family HTH domain